MKILLLNTCGTEATLALADTALADPFLMVPRMPGRTASERLVAELRGAMGEAGWKPRDLAGIVVVTGPGSFTGVRVGLSAAKGLSEASGVPLIAVSRLAMLAAAARPCGQRVCALLDAGRNDFYCAEFEGSSLLGENLLGREAAIAAGWEAEVAIACEAAVWQKLGSSVALRMVDEPTAADALPLALARLTEGCFDDAMTLDASYLRQTDAEIFSPKTGMPKSEAKAAARRVG